nr:putative protein TPRXL [Dermatophagoides farinae]
MPDGGWKQPESSKPKPSVSVPVSWSKESGGGPKSSKGPTFSMEESSDELEESSIELQKLKTSPPRTDVAKSIGQKEKGPGILSSSDFSKSKESSSSSTSDESYEEESEESSKERPSSGGGGGGFSFGPAKKSPSSTTKFNRNNGHY